MAIKLTITVQFFSSMEEPINTDTFILSRVDENEIDDTFLDEFIECSIGEGTHCQFLNNILDNEYKTENNTFYENKIKATHEALTGDIYNWKILNYKVEKVA